MYSLFFAAFYLCENHYKLITVQCYMADYVSWVPKITLWDLRTNWIYKFALRMELFICNGLTVSWICTHLTVAGFDSVLVCGWFLTFIVCLPFLLIFHICDASVSSHSLSCWESFRNCCKAVVMSDCLNFTCLCSFFNFSIESKQEPSLLAFWLFYLFLNHIFSFSILPQWHVLSCAHVKVQKYTFINGTYYTSLWSMTGQCIKHTPEMILTT